MLKTIQVIFVIFFCAPAFSQSPDLEGKNELSLQGLLDFQGANGDNIDLRAGYGWYLRDGLLIGGNYRWQLSEDIAPGENDYRSQQASVEIEYLLTGDTSLVPYLGAEIGFRNIRFDTIKESGLVLGGVVGLKYFLADSVSIDASIGYFFADKDVFLVDFEASDDYLFPSFGINAIF